MKFFLVRLAFAATLAESLAAATFQVSTTADADAGSLRQAILDANASPGPDLITFNLPGAGPQTIVVVSGELPAVTDPVVIDGTTQPGYAGAPLVFLDGNFKKSRSGLTITGGGSTIRGLAFGNFGTGGATGLMFGLVLQDGGSNHIEACHLGVDAAGTGTKRNTSGGILVTNSAANVIGGSPADARNVIAGNSGPGVLITGPGASNNVVAGNRVGLAADGATLVAGTSQGVLITGGASGNQIGGTTPGAGNAVAGTGDSITLSGGAAGNRIEGNFVGLRADGTALPGGPANGSGVVVSDAPDNVVGGLAAGAGNVLSGNQAGVFLKGPLATGNRVLGNLIGTDPAGKSAIPNHFGVFLGGGAHGNVIGGTLPGSGNVISGNVTHGVTINNSSSNAVQGNLIGTDVSGTLALGNATPANQSAGVNIAATTAPAAGNLIGGPEPGAGNLISGNQFAGIVIVGTLAAGNRIEGNLVGTDRSGRQALGNLGDGVLLLGTDSTRIGGLGATSGNVIAANGGIGINLAATFGSFGLASSNTVIVGNRVGLGLPALPAARAATSRARPASPPPAPLPFANLGGGIFNTVAENTCIGLPDNSAGNQVAQGGGLPCVQVIAGNQVGVFAGDYRTTQNAPFLIVNPLANEGVTAPTVLSAVRDHGSLTITTAVPPGPAGAEVALQFLGVYQEADGVLHWTGLGATWVTPKGVPGETFTYTFPDPGGTFHVTAESTYNGKDSSPSAAVVDVNDFFGGAATYSFGFPALNLVRQGDRLQGSGSVQRTGDATAPGHVSARFSQFLSEYPAIRSTPALPPVLLDLPAGQTMVTLPVDLSQPVRSHLFQFSYVDLESPSAGATLGTPSALVLIQSPDNPPPAPPVLQIDAPPAGDLRLSWTGYHYLQMTESLGGPWTTLAGAVPPYPVGFREMPTGYFRLTDEVPEGSLSGHVGTQPGIVLGIGDGGRLAVTGDGGGFSPLVVPAGDFDFMIYARTAVSDPVTGTVVNQINRVPFPVTVSRDTPTVIEIRKLELTPKADRPPCGCTPWCGVLGGTVNGVQQVVAFGGKNGQCDELAVVTITAPDGTIVTNPARRRLFKPAPDGTWTVSSTVCGVTKTCTITLP